MPHDRFSSYESKLTITRRQKRSFFCYYRHRSQIKCDVWGRNQSLEAVQLEGRSLMVNSDYRAVKSLCNRLGVEQKAEGSNQRLRNEVLLRLSRGFEKLTRLVEQDHVTLYQLGKHELLPKVSSAIYGSAPAELSACSWKNKCLHQKIGELSELDFTTIKENRRLGSASLAIVAEVIRLSMETSGFRTLLVDEANLENDQSLIERIAKSVASDPKMKRRLLAMFPQPSPS
jgi:hypothetical protein